MTMTTPTLNLPDAILLAARRDPRPIVLAEGTDARIIAGATRAAADGLAHITLLGAEAEITRRMTPADQDHAARARARHASALTLVDPGTSPLRAEFAGAWLDLRRHKGADEAMAAAAMANPLGFAAMMVRRDHAAASIAGAVATTADTVRTALQIIGPAEKGGLVSTFMLILPPGGGPPLLFADCALVVDPDAGELAAIALAAARSRRAVIGDEPRVAMLSFSTLGSARHELAAKVANATRLVREQEPDLAIEGEIQFDAAFAPDVAAQKAPGSAVAGRANVFVFPDLAAANIGYKIAERIGGARAVGPVLQGLVKPANDLSRGCNAADIYDLIALTCLQAQNPSPPPA